MSAQQGPTDQIICTYACTCCTHINFGGLGESPDRVNVVIQDDDTYHHPHAEQHGVCVGEPTAVLPGTKAVMEESQSLFNLIEAGVVG